jgi:hypothetical protein
MISFFNTILPAASVTVIISLSGMVVYKLIASFFLTGTGNSKYFPGSMLPAQFAE